VRMKGRHGSGDHRKGLFIVKTLTPRSQSGVTLTELLAVIALIGLLILVFLLPMIKAVWNAVKTLE